MEENRDLTMVVVGDNNNFKISQGMKALMVKNKSFVFIWCDSQISVYEITTKGNQIVDDVRNSSKKSITLKSYVIDIFESNDSPYVLDEKGVLYTLQISTSEPVNYMEVEDLFSSPTSESTSEWKETVVTTFSECDKVKHICTVTSCVALLAMKDEQLTVFIYFIPEYKLKFTMDLSKYGCQDAVISSCDISEMSPRLKRNFKRDLEVFDDEIIVIGLSSGLLLWFCTNKPSKGPFVLFNTYQEVQSIHWIKDSNSGLYKYLLIITSSGQIAVFGEEPYSILYLPDSVKSSYCLDNFIVTSNYIDCYASKIQMDKNISLKCVSLPVKGVCAMTRAPGPDTLLTTATVHGSVYCFDPTAAPPEHSSHFTLPDQSLLDHMFLQSQQLDQLYKQLNHEEDVLRAVSATVAANCGQDLFQAAVNVVSGGVFSVVAKVQDSKLSFPCELWNVCIEVISGSGEKETSFHKMEHELNYNNDLLVNVNRSLSVDDVVSIELVYFLESKQPLLIIPVGKVVIDAGYLMRSQTGIESTIKTEETLESILDNMENDVLQQTLNECKLTIELPADCPVNSLFKTILTNSQQRFTLEEWDRLSSGRKFNVSVIILNFPVLLQLEVESRELVITSCSTKLCHQIKEAVATRLKRADKKCISESLSLALQAIHQAFEIESLKETPNVDILDSLRRNLRATVSAKMIL